MQNNRRLFFAFLCLLFSNCCLAQKRVGFYAGNNFSSMRIDPQESVTQKNRLIIGGFTSRQIGNGINSVFGLQYIEKGGNFDAVDTKLNYLQLDLGFQVGATKERGGAYLTGGVGLGGLVSARGRIPSASVSLKELFQGGELSCHGGIGFRIRTFFIEGIYASSIISVVKEEFPLEAFNNGFQLKAGLSFRLW